jgi:branched-chain amino acid transport system permease protein
VEYLFHIIVMASFFAALAVSLDLAVGQLGILSLCHSAFYAAGAYTLAVFLEKGAVPFPLAWLLGGIVAVTLSLPQAWIARRLRHDSIVLATMAILLIVIEFIENLRSVTGGLDGITGIPHARFGPVVLRTEFSWAIAGVIVLAVTVFVVQRIRNSPLGRSLRSYRDDPVAAVALGVQPKRTIGMALALSAGLAGLAGGLYASYASFISPAVFGFDQSVLILAMVVLGGAATTNGPLLGGLILVLIPEALRFAGFESAKVGAFQQTLFGAALLAFVLWRPRGLLKGYKFR